ncbi:BhlA/UviB family holin-like peptide [Tumebacillus permanentifrigoris]|uniref:BhlA-like holin n=1 Tax=Tumebacillus permanentifrigoris TaxID=378543 RepID=A0A316D6H7_9BACL|nr:BhlA/UviB family holin-like peptide [Tumebacillus permanentifrigoris]PWK07491.1 BhlA-like holin [Tumebacillus permanentifrigoris]
MVEENLIAIFQGQGPWALLFVVLFMWNLRENKQREGRLIDVIDRLSEKYDEMAVDLHDIKETLKKTA